MEPEIYRAREAIGVFSSLEQLESAVDQLEISGFDRAAISVLGPDRKVKKRLGCLDPEITTVADDGRTPQAAFASRDSWVEGEAAILGMPLYAGGIAGAVAASSGALAATIAATLAGGAAGVGIERFSVALLARQRAARAAKQLAQGEFILWVCVWNDDSEARALRTLAAAGAGEVHAHDIEREWTVSERPLAEAQPDLSLAVQWTPVSGGRCIGPSRGPAVRGWSSAGAAAPLADATFKLRGGA